MNASETLDWLRARGKEQTAKTYRRHAGNAEAQALGVSFADMYALVKLIKKDHALARELWDMAFFETRVVAMLIVDPAAITKADAERWTKDIDDHGTSAQVATALAQSPSAQKWAEAYIDSKKEFPSATGWTMIADLAKAGRLDEAHAAGFLERIAKDLHAAPNRTRYSMNSALIAIGGYLPTLREQALATAKTIGVVEVDHGDTACETPDAATYIAKMAARSAPKAKTKKVKA